MSSDIPALVLEVLSTAGTGLGGNRIDQMIYTQLLFPELGEGETWTREVDGRVLEGAFPFQEYETGLLNWQTTYLLNQNATKSKVVERIAQGGPAAVKFERLKDLISYNYSYNCFQAIRKAKAALSQVEETVLDIPEINLAIPFTRAMLDEILEPALETLRQFDRRGARGRGHRAGRHQSRDPYGRVVRDRGGEAAAGRALPRQGDRARSVHQRGGRVGHRQLPGNS